MTNQALLTTPPPPLGHEGLPYSASEQSDFKYATQLLEQAFGISRLDYTNVLLTGTPLCAIKPLQMIQNLIFDWP